MKFTVNDIIMQQQLRYAQDFAKMIDILYDEQIYNNVFHADIPQVNF